MLKPLAELSLRHRRVIIACSVAFTAFAGVVGGSLESHLTNGGFSDPGASSSRAEQVMTERFRRPPSNFVLVATTPGHVDSGPAASAGTRLTESLAKQPEVEAVTSYWTAGHSAELRSRDGRSALVLAHIRGDDHAVRQRAANIAELLGGDRAGLSVRAGGSALVSRAIDETAQRDLRRAELIAAPITLLLLLLVFGSPVAALLPMACGGLAVFGTMLILRMLTAVTSISVFALNITTGLGLALAVDYSLFIVSRYRTERRTGSPKEALPATLSTAGRTVLFSGLTLSIAMAALTVFPIGFLRSIAYAGVAVVVLAMGSSLLTLPAVLVALDRHLDAGNVHRLLRTADAPRHASGSRGMWYRLARSVQRRPCRVAAVVSIFLVALGLPFLHAQLARADDRTLPRSDTVRLVEELVRTDFPARLSDSLTVVAPAATAPGSAIDAYARRLLQLADVGAVQTAIGTYREGTQAGLVARDALPEAAAPWFVVLPTVDASSPAGHRLAANVRDLPAPFPTIVGGAGAEQLDTSAAIRRCIGWALGIVAVSAFALLLLLTGSVLLPVKALITNALTLCSMFGAMVWVFQEGHLRTILGNFTVTGTIDSTTPVLMFCIAFGLCMDYEILVLSRIIEAREQGRVDSDAVAVGLQHAAPLMTAAAGVLMVVFASFLVADVSFIKLLGVGLAVAVGVDATLVRGMLVPACMELAGRANWWAPGRLRVVLSRLQLAESAGFERSAASLADRRRRSGRGEKIFAQDIRPLVPVRE